MGETRATSRTAAAATATTRKHMASFIAFAILLLSTHPANAHAQDSSNNPPILPGSSLDSLLPTPTSPPSTPHDAPQLPLHLPPSPLPLPAHQRRQAPGQPAQATPTSSSLNIPQNVAAGGLSFLTPAITDALSYHKIYPSVPLTFGFTYTSLISTPASLTLEAFCSQNGNTYPVGPIGPDGSLTNSIPGAATSVVWDPYAYAQQGGAVPFADATYTLRVHDERGMGVGASPGLLAPNANVRFALYSATPYTPLASWTCAGCNGANALQVRSLMIALPITAMLMVAGAWGVMGRAAAWRYRA